MTTNQPSLFQELTLKRGDKKTELAIDEMVDLMFGGEYAQDYRNLKELLLILNSDEQIKDGKLASLFKVLHLDQTEVFDTLVQLRTTELERLVLSQRTQLKRQQEIIDLLKHTASLLTGGTDAN